MWKMACNDACEMMHKYWLACFEKVRTAVYQNDKLTKEQKHYANYVLKDNSQLYSRLQLLLNRQLIAVSTVKPKKSAGDNLFCGPIQIKPLIAIADKDRNKVVDYLFKKIKQLRGNYPKVKLARSMVLDANMYDVKQDKAKNQYLAVMSLKSGKRIRIPLSGNLAGKQDAAGKIYFGNIRLVLSDKRQRKIEMHYSVDISIKPVNQPESVNRIGLDAGYTEVFADNNNFKYGKDFGLQLQDKSDKLSDKNKKRAKLRSLADNYDLAGKHEKASQIRKYNLGTFKYDRYFNKATSSTECMINSAINQVYEKNKSDKPLMIVTEDLSKAISRKIGKRMNRRLSSWTKGIIAERIEFKALVKGFSHQVVNAAYTSQTCPNEDCGYVDKRNRNADKFKCLKCGHMGHSDHIAAINIARRAGYPGITLYTPYTKVKEILMVKFNSIMADRQVLKTQVSDTCVSLQVDNKVVLPLANPPIVVTAGPHLAAG
jgi:IS605 OrfB family transposase